MDPKTLAKELDTETVSIRLAQQIKSTKKKIVSGATVARGITPIAPDTAEYFYMTNALVKRGVEQTAGAIMRNGFEVICASDKDAEIVETFRSVNRLDDRMLNITRNTAIYGNAYFELYDSDLGVRIEELPPAEIDFRRDEEEKILYKKDGTIDGYVQRRLNEDIASWNADLITHFRFNTIGAADLGISMLQPVSFPATEFGLIRANNADSFIRSLNVVHVTVEGATPEDLEEVSYNLSQQFTAESAYITSDRYKIQNAGNVGNQVDPSVFLEPNIAEIAAAFNMPIELISATTRLKGDDFEPRYAEWLESIRVKQSVLSKTLEEQVFNRITDEPCEVIFNSPRVLDANTLIKNVGFAVQSKAITEEQAQDILQRAQVFGVGMNEGDRN